MLYAVQRLLLSPLLSPLRMTSTRPPAAAPAAATVSKRLRELADQLDARTGTAAFSLVAEELQLLTQQLRADRCSRREGTDDTSTTKPHAATLEQLEHIYTAPAATKQQQRQHCTPQHQPETQTASKKQKRAPKSFDFAKYRQRFVALQLMYIGWDYHGFARQADTDNTIEGKLFPALRKVKLIPDAVEVSALEYSRCGRTDKGVSALGQVLSLNLRSAAVAGDELPAADDELDYCNIINRALPDDMRVLGWADIQPDFNARFSALDREYKYFIVQDGGIDLCAMQEAASYLVGEHDFRNFCKADVGQVRNFLRHVLSAVVEPAGVTCAGMNVIALRIKGTAFLWHQVRCIAAILLMVGRSQEQPEIIKQLLDISKVPCKPQYSMAAEKPLLLFSCGFDGLEWRRSEGLLDRNLAVIGGQLEKHLIAAALTSCVYEELQQHRQELQQQQQHVSGLQDQQGSGVQEEQVVGSHEQQGSGSQEQQGLGLQEQQGLGQQQQQGLVQQQQQGAGLQEQHNLGLQEQGVDSCMSEELQQQRQELLHQQQRQELQQQQQGLELQEQRVLGLQGQWGLGLQAQHVLGFQEQQPAMQDMQFNLQQQLPRFGVHPQVAEIKQQLLPQQVQQQRSNDTIVALARQCRTATNDNSAPSSSSSSSSSRWLAPKPPHIPLLNRATEPSIEERFVKAGISLELLNQRGLAAFQDA